MTASTNRTRMGGFLQSEANFARARDQVTIHGGTGGAGVLYAGAVLGKITSGGKYVSSPDTGSDGSQTGVAVLFEDIDATNGDVQASVISRAAEVRQADLTYDASIGTDATKIAAKNAQLALVGIIVR